MSAMRGGQGSLQLISHLEALLTQTAEPSRAEVEAAHALASESIRRVNARLSQAYQLISDGRRAEAIEIAEGPPHVLDEIASLDSQMIRDWEHYSGQFGLPRFAPLRSDLATLLNGAYTAENQLEHLLRRHRTLSIGRANLKQRIATLTQLAAADSSSPQWTKSLGQCQQLRLEQLATRAGQAARLEDLRCLKLLITELRATRWVVSVPKSLVDSISAAIDRLQSRESTTEAIAIAEHIQDARADGNSMRLGPLIHRYREIESFVDEVALGDAMPALRSVVDWHDSEVRQQQLAAAQQSALANIGQISTESDAREIRNVMENIVTTGAAVPEELRNVYIEKVRADAQSKRLKAMVVAAAVAAAILITVSIAAVVYRSYQNEAALEKMAKAIEDKLRTGQLEAAGSLLASAPLSDERFAPFRTQWDELKLAEKVRADAFVDEAGGIEQRLDSASEVAEFERLSLQLGELNDRVQTDAESATTTHLSQAIEAARARQLAQRISEAKATNETIRQDLKALVPDKNARTTLSRWNQQLQKLRTDRWLRDQSELLSTLAGTSNAVADQYDLIRSRADAERSIAKITNAVGDWRQWERLAANAQQMDPSVTGKFLSLERTVENEKALWTDVEAWNSIATAWTVDDLISAAPGRAMEAKKVVAEIHRLGLADVPSAADFLAVAEVAIPVASRSPRTLEVLIAHLKSPKMSDIGAIKVSATPTSNPRWFYFPVAADGSGEKSISSSSNQLRIEAYIDLAAVRTESTTVVDRTIEIPADFEARRGEYVSGIGNLRAPHVSLARSLARSLGSLPGDEDGLWDRTFVQAYRDVMAAESVDPLIRYFLVDAVLNIGSQGSWMITTAYAPHRRFINQAKINTDVNWIAAGNDEAATARQYSAEALKKLSEIKAVDPRPILDEMRQHRNVTTTYRPVGWIDQTDGRWIVRIRDAVADSGPLVVRYPVGDGDRSATTTIGRLDAGNPILSEVLPKETLQVGRPAWIAEEKEFRK